MAFGVALVCGLDFHVGLVPVVFFIFEVLLSEVFYVFVDYWKLWIEVEEKSEYYGTKANVEFTVFVV